MSLVGKGRPANAPVAANAALRRTSSSEEMAMFSERTRRRTFYKDSGSGQPIVFSPGWPLSADDWDAQLMFFLGRGYRVIAHDRRGGLIFGYSNLNERAITDGITRLARAVSRLR